MCMLLLYSYFIFSKVLYFYFVQRLSACKPKSNFLYMHMILASKNRFWGKVGFNNNIYWLDVFFLWITWNEMQEFLWYLTTDNFAAVISFWPRPNSV